MSKGVGIYERMGVVYVRPSNQTEAGWWLDDEEVVALKAPTPSELKAAVIAALSRSHTIPNPPTSAAHGKRLLALAGVKSWRAFSKKAKCVRVRQDGSTIKIKPYKYLGGRQGFEEMLADVLVVNASDKDVGEAIARAIELAK